ncbi:MAG: hypothetical protein AB7I59_12410 [Geminicoccaceae bacterium]
MTPTVKELRDALMEAGASPAKADAAVEAVLDRHDRAELATKSDLKTGLAELETRVVRELRDQVWQFVGVSAAIVPVVVAAIKLLP